MSEKNKLNRKQELGIFLGALDLCYENYKDSLGNHLRYSYLDDETIDKFYYGVLDELKKFQEKLGKFASYVVDVEETFVESTVPLKLVLECDSSPGAIPVGGKLIHSTNWLELLGTHFYSGFAVHPLTISLNDAAKEKLDQYSYVQVWKLVAYYDKYVTIQAMKVDELSEYETKAYNLATQEWEGAYYE